jgi:hypothetical protein
MSIITVAYVALLLAGAFWIGIRIRNYVRSQSESETRWDELLSDDEFKTYVEKLKQETMRKNQEVAPAEAVEKENPE